MRSSLESIAPAWGIAVLVTAAFTLTAGAQDSARSELPATSSSESPVAHDNQELEWLTSYADAVKLAKSENKMVAVCFDRPANNQVVDALETFADSSEEAQQLLDALVLVRVDTDTQITADELTKPLIQFDAFREMRNSPGVALIDYRDEEQSHYGTVVSVYPINERRKLDEDSVPALLTLPPGSLTQRTLVLAVRMHREEPSSANADWSPVLATAVESHSEHQARINLQGHHNWESRFHRINGRLGLGLRSQEVCAESWPGQSLVDAAEECVDSWRQSPGHWSAVSGRQTLFAYDMKRGSNGVWYATGIFAR